MDSIFINALVKAGSCEQHARQLPPQTLPPTSTFMYHQARRRRLHTIIRHPRIFRPRSGISRHEYLNLVDYYRDPIDKDLTANLMDSSKPVLNLPQPILKEQEPKIEESDTSTSEPRNDEEVLAIQRLESLLNDKSITHATIFEAYKALPFPGVVCLSDSVRWQLFHRLAVIETKDQASMLRYLSIVEDMKVARLPLTTWQWNSAIAYAGRCLVRVSATEVESALRIWKEMEQDAGIKSNHVTFNILFDIAARAGKFVLAEMILKEMEAREFEINRYGSVGFIFYSGLKGDGDGVRKAYRDFVTSSNIVDTMVLNCVICSLIRAGELPAAEQVYERMKQIWSSKTGARLPPLNWKGTRDLGHALETVRVRWKNNPEKIQEVQLQQFLAPNVRTYVVFLEHHANRTGELQRITTLLNEMQFLGIPMHGRIFVKLFKGFAKHGGIRYSSWTRSKLERVYESLLQTLDQGLEDVRLEKWMIKWALMAFAKCDGMERMWEVWEELRGRWEPDEHDLYLVNQCLQTLS
ncbi:hypothetical protein MMC12_002119 [Toensbergia leucococca]|nr:hypothetical protein [Toensbergia leucococca]